MLRCSRERLGRYKHAVASNTRPRIHHDNPRGSARPLSRLIRRPREIVRCWGKSADQPRLIRESSQRAKIVHTRRSHWSKKPLANALPEHTPRNPLVGLSNDARSKHRGPHQSCSLGREGLQRSPELRVWCLEDAAKSLSETARLRPLLGDSAHMSRSRRQRSRLKRSRQQRFRLPLQSEGRSVADWNRCAQYCRTALPRVSPLPWCSLASTEPPSTELFGRTRQSEFRDALTQQVVEFVHVAFEL